MPVFNVKAATEEGRVVIRKMEADSEGDISMRLESEGLHPIEISSASLGSFFSTPLMAGRKALTRAEFMVFNRGLMALLKAGVPVVECLDTLSQRSPSVPFKAAVSAVTTEVRSGKTLSESMKKHPATFPPLYTATIGSGESTGDLVPAIGGYLDYTKRVESIRKKMVRALSYPLVLSGLLFAATIFLMLVVVPTFSKVYADTGGDLPTASMVLFSISDFLRSKGLIVLFVIAGICVAIYFYVRSPGGKIVMDKLKLTLPQIGGIYRGYAVSTFSRTLAMVLRSGVHLVHSLEMAKGVLGNSVLEEKLDYVIKSTREGGTVTDAMSKVSFMPEVTLRMFSVGEKTATLPDMLTDIADFHDEEVDHKMTILSNLIEPALMIIMGLVVGSIVILLYLPIFQMGANF